MITYEQIEKANSEAKPSPIKNKPYIEVNERIKAFRKVYPTGSIMTEMVSNENGVCIFRATVGFEDESGFHILGSGTAYEKEGSSFINETSYIENCETSACGRALGMAGFGIDTSVASFEEVSNAIANQTQSESEERKATPKQIELLSKKYTGENLEKLLKANNITKLEDLSITTASNIIGKFKKTEENK